MKIEVATEDRNGVTGPMKIGIGTEAQFPALYNAGAQEVRTPDWVQLNSEDEDDLLGLAFRTEDTVIMVQPNLLSVDLIKRLSAKVSGFQVPQCSDHAPDGIFRLNTDKAVRRFRQLKPDLEGVVRVENRHGKIKYPQPTQAQIDVIIGWWWDTSIKRSAVEAKVSAMLNADIPHHKIRDWVAKATGSPARQLHQFYAENIWKDVRGHPDLLEMLDDPDHANWQDYPKATGHDGLWQAVLNDLRRRNIDC